uniref:Uncharacterized protein n=1 Tax=Sus scrofa TaxID=9823 RepID=A0A8D1XV38_PIG
AADLQRTTCWLRRAARACRPLPAPALPSAHLSCFLPWSLGSSWCPGCWWLRPPDPWSWLPPHLLGTLSCWWPRGWGQLVFHQHRGVSFADLLQKKSIGAREETGFTEESNKNPIVFQPPSQALPGDPVLLPSRSVTKSDFTPVTHPHGSEFLPVMARGSERETGFSRGNERTLNPRVPPPSGPEPSSMSHRQFQPPKRVQQTNVALLGRETVGNKVRPEVPSN